MPALAFGLNKANSKSSGVPSKRKAAFDEPDDNAPDGEEDRFGALAKPKFKSLPLSKPSLSSITNDRLNRSSKLSNEPLKQQDSSKYTNLSALRSAKLQDNEASQLDVSVYDYDAVYDTCSAEAQKKKRNTSSSDEPTVPKYMSNLLASAEVRKRDQLRAKEKALQKEREEEGEEFRDKEQFVTEAYKKQQEEIRRIEEEEKRREEEEEERRKKGGGMTGFYGSVLKKDEERQKAVEEAAKNTLRNDAEEPESTTVKDEKTDSKLAAELNEQGVKILVNDDGEIVDKRQLLTAGLNVVLKKKDTDVDKGKTQAQRPQEWQRSSKQDARLSQRERQSRMMEQQIAEIEAKQKEAELAEQKALEDKNKTKITQTDKMSAKERYLQRKREREEEAKKAKGAAG